MNARVRPCFGNTIVRILQGIQELPAMSDDQVGTLLHRIEELCNKRLCVTYFCNMVAWRPKISSSTCCHVQMMNEVRKEVSRFISDCGGESQESLFHLMESRSAQECRG